MQKFYALLLALSVATISAHAATKTTKHTIQNGETLFTIARKHHTTIAEVRKTNHMKKGETLKLGRVLTVPVNTYFPDKKQKTIQKKSKKRSAKLAKYSIKNGDTLFVIARKHHTTIAEVRKANHMKKGETLKLGRVLTVPLDTYFPDKKQKTAQKKSKKRSAKLAKYSIKNGDTLFVIARKHHTTIAEVRKANHMKKGETLKLGRVLNVPQNTYNVSKTKIAQTRKKKTYNKKLVASLSSKKLSTVRLDRKKIKHKRSFTINSRKHSAVKCDKIISLAKKKLGRRYVWGATGKKNTFDCSGFTKYVYKKNGITIPRTSINQSKYGKYVSRKNLKKGDLIFFDTSKKHRGYVNHVGIYLGNGKFIHASSAKKKVVITSLHKKFYSQRYKVARRPS